MDKPRLPTVSQTATQRTVMGYPSGSYTRVNPSYKEFLKKVIMIVVEVHIPLQADVCIPSRCWVFLACERMVQWETCPCSQDS